MSQLTIILIVCSFWIYVIQSEVVKRSLSCKENEMFVECSHCGPKTCDDLGHPVPCGGGTGICRPQCVCIDGYVRDANNTCIPKVDCPSCGGDFNATTGCGNHCSNSCSDYKDVNKTCLSGCRYNSCDCKENYVFHDQLQKCVLPVDCSSCGGDFNATTGCGNHCSNSCSDYKDVNKTCLSGCRYNSCDCKENYVFHDQLQKCVLPVDCCEYPLLFS